MLIYYNLPVSLANLSQCLCFIPGFRMSFNNSIVGLKFSICVFISLATLKVPKIRINILFYYSCQIFKNNRYIYFYRVFQRTVLYFLSLSAKNCLTEVLKNFDQCQLMDFATKHSAF